MVRLPQPLSVETSPRTQRNGLEKCQKEKVCEDSEDQEKNGIEQFHAISIKHPQISPNISNHSIPTISKRIPMSIMLRAPQLETILGVWAWSMWSQSTCQRSSTKTQCWNTDILCVCAETPNTNMYIYIAPGSLGHWLLDHLNTGITWTFVGSHGHGFLDHLNIGHFGDMDTTHTFRFWHLGDRGGRDMGTWGHGALGPSTTFNQQRSHL